MNTLKLLVHCNLDVLKIGFEELIKKISYQIKITYANLNLSLSIKNCILNNYDFIVIIPSTLDENYTLCQKLYLFIPHIPIIFLNYSIPSNYKKYLQENNVFIIMENPFDYKYLEIEITKHLRNNINNH